MTRSLPARLALPTAFLTAVLCANAAAQSVPCFEPDFGQDLSLFDDSVSGTLALGFTFPFPRSAGFTTIQVSSNGYLWLGSGVGSGCCNGDVGGFLSGGPRIAPAWFDLNPSAGGSVHFNTFPGRAVVTWNGVPEFAAANENTFQVQLLSDGRIVLAYDRVRMELHNGVTGITPGGELVDPGESDLSFDVPFDSGGKSTVYEFFTTGGGGGDDLYDLDDTSFTFTPNGTDGWVVRSEPCVRGRFEEYGTGCPPDPCFETDTGNDLSMSDDSVSSPLALGFVYPYPGTAGFSRIQVSSNGFVWFGARATDSGCCNGNVAGFLSGRPRIAPGWFDLNPSAGGAVRFNSFGDRAVVTWEDVPEFGSSNRSTFQVQLFQDGSIQMSWISVTSSLHTALVGITAGNGAADPGESDLSNPPFDSGTQSTIYEFFPGGVDSLDLSNTSIRFTLNGNGGYQVDACQSQLRPLGLASAASSTPVLGGTVRLDVSRIPNVSSAGVLAVGTAAKSVDLTPFGMTDCTQLNNHQNPLPINVTPPMTQLGVSVPSDPTLAGAVAYFQVVLVAPGINPLGVIASNGGRVVIGN